MFDFYAQKTNLMSTSLLDLSDTFLLIDDYDRAENYNNILLEQIPTNHSDVPKIYNHLANIYRCHGKFTEAERYLAFIDESQLREVIDNSTLCDIHISRGLMYDAMRNYKLARYKLFEANSLVEDDNIQRAQILKSVGLTYKHEQNYKSSLHYYEEALKIEENLLPLKHPSLIDAYD